MKKMLNLGCGNSFHKDWINIDFNSNNENIIACNLNNGIPFENDCFDVVYHSHVLEHFAKDKADSFLGECFRVLKPGGILRVAVPDLEQIARLYIQKLEEKKEDDYDWMMLEMYDQTVRNYSGGEMYKYFQQENISNLDFVLSRIGHEAESMIANIQANKNNLICENIPNKPKKRSFLSKLIKKLKTKPKNEESLEEKIGKFRLAGEIHQWMYDSFSLTRLLKKAGFTQIEKKTAFVSQIVNFSNYNLDVLNNKTRKPESLFMECRKPERK